MKSIYKIALTLLAFASATKTTKAQLDPLAAQYYSNQYLANPAMAGAAGESLKLNAVYRKLWSNIQGSPLTQNITADYGFNNRVGLGININNQSAGLQRQTRVMASYAYHIPLGAEGQQLHFGISAGVLSQRLENSDIYGNPNDVMVANYNGRKTYLDGDFGTAYTSGHFNLQATIPNLKSFFKKDEIKQADVATFYSAMSYRISFSKGTDGVDLEPKVAFRGVKGYDNIWDAGTQLTLADRQILLTGIYHSSQSATFGLGMDFRKKYLISGMYTTQTSALSGYTNGTFELSIGGKF
ncbi:PorP/SprF family type IX secretion system membrane protein [Pedobacter sp. MC2016-14]|uniref:PorP/SprF family type IX secretion system membrane protein n=1 Tax=Pedobacter sp. MC2016-14 TaxID=2897327 RepID=UPI001E587090|nr:PorP/SprF family type IX secretion system membrane protein [Pedobacter sp. MC2016-14]MCD0489494.1 PorP/SprF family type IX secretion system membrane protein [Pedobacter sp. MC2016-14]